ncbi:MAG: hypothetical protein ACLS48_14115, partial [[Eubacterium] siraeum]
STVWNRRVSHGGFYAYVQNTQNPADNFGYNLTLATLQCKVHCVILSTTKQKGAVYESTT